MKKILFLMSMGLMISAHATTDPLPPTGNDSGRITVMQRGEQPDAPAAQGVDEYEHNAPARSFNPFAACMPRCPGAVYGEPNPLYNHDGESVGVVGLLKRACSAFTSCIPGLSQELKEKAE